MLVVIFAMYYLNLFKFFSWLLSVLVHSYQSSLFRQDLILDGELNDLLPIEVRNVLLRLSDLVHVELRSNLKEFIPRFKHSEIFSFPLFV